MSIYLVRHGQAAAGTEDLDPGLADAGHRQAQLVAEHLAAKPLGRLLVSPLRRTQETAAPIAERTGLAPELRDEVAEVFDPDMPVEERRSMIGPFMASRWGEQNATLRAWRERVLETLREAGLAAESAGHDLVVVSHYIAIGAAVGAAMGDDRVVPAPIANASISTLVMQDGELALVEAGATGHLPEELVTGAGQAMAGGGNTPPR